MSVVCPASIARRASTPRLRCRIQWASDANQGRAAKEPPCNPLCFVYVAIAQFLRDFTIPSVSTPIYPHSSWTEVGGWGPPLHSVARSRGSISLSDAGNPLAANRLFDVCGVGHYFAAEDSRIVDIYI